ncbi:MAG: patatin-like phospholipase family protein, partial [Spirochaetota bacterium]
KGFAHIGVIKALLESGVPIDMIGGTSMGSIIGSLHAMGHLSEAMIRINRQCWVDTHPMRDWTIPVVSVLRGSVLERAFAAVYGDLLVEDLWLDFFAISTNLSRARMEIHDSGTVFHAARASSSYPCLALPVLHNGEVCVDGGVVNNLPVDVMQARGARTLVAVDVSSGESSFRVDLPTMPSSWEVFWSRVLPFRTRIDVPTITDTLMALTTLSSQQRQEATRRAVDLYLTPPTSGFGLLDFRKIDEIVEAGYRHTMDRLSGGAFPAIPST